MKYFLTIMLIGALPFSLLAIVVYFASLKA